MKKYRVHPQIQAPTRRPGVPTAEEDPGSVEGDEGSEEEEDLVDDGEEVQGISGDGEFGGRELVRSVEREEDVGEEASVLDDESDILSEEEERIRAEGETLRLLSLFLYRLVRHGGCERVEERNGEGEMVVDEREGAEKGDTSSSSSLPF